MAQSWIAPSLMAQRLMAQRLMAQRLMAQRLTALAGFAEHAGYSQTGDSPDCT